MSEMWTFLDRAPMPFIPDDLKLIEYGPTKRWEILASVDDAVEALRCGTWCIDIDRAEADRVTQWLFGHLGAEDPVLVSVLAYGPNSRMDGGVSYFWGSRIYEAAFSDAVARAIAEDERADPCLDDIIDSHLTNEHGHYWHGWPPTTKAAVRSLLGDRWNDAFVWLDSKRCGEVTTKGTRCKSGAKQHGVCNIHAKVQ